MVWSEKENEEGPFRFVASVDRRTDLFYMDLLRRIRGAVLVEVGEEELLSLILSGSLAMGEGCAYPSPEGGLSPGSDIDLYIVTSEGNAGELGARMAGFRERLLSALGVRGLVVDLGVTTPDRLARLGPSIASCLLGRYGKVLAGDPEALRSAARPAYEEIPPRDGFLLLSNRTMEELAEFQVRPAGAESEWSFWYRYGKTVRDVGTSALVAGGSFLPTMRGRREVLPDFLRREGLESVAPGFAGEHSFWCGQKEKPDLAAVRSRYGGDGALASARMRLPGLLDAFWAWEWERVFGAPEGEGGLTSLRRADPLRRRARAWAVHLRRTGGGSAGAFLRHASHGLPATPLLANYAAARFLVACSGPIAGEAETERDRELLARAAECVPLRVASRGGFRARWLSLRESVCGYWNREVMRSMRPPCPLEGP